MDINLSMIILQTLVGDEAPHRVTETAWIITAVGMSVVFTSLILIYIVFSLVPKILSFKFKKEPVIKGEGSASTGNQPIAGELNAAISATLFFYFNELHDEEKTVLTINKISKRYSPWSSKIYGVTRHLQSRF